MKNFFKSVGKASIYFLVYLATQFIVSFVYGMVWSAKITAELTAAGEALDAMALTEQLAVQIMDKAMEMTFWAGVITLIIYWIRFAVRKKNFLKEVEMKKVPVKSLLPVIILAPSANIVLSMVITYFPWPQAWIDAYMANSAPLDGSLMSWLTAVVMAPVLEEIVFRGLVYTRLKKGMPTIVAAIVASLAFGLCHGTAIWIIYATALGLIMTWIFERYQSLAANIVFHLVFNATGLVINMIPESMEIVLWIFAAAGVVGIVYGVKQMMKIAVEVPVIEQVEEISVEICE